MSPALRRYATADVFTDQRFHGNPVAVVLEAENLSPAQMQAVAREFNDVETTFVLPPQDPAHTARVRIFTPVREVPFAGHPNIGTAFVLAREAAARGEAPARMAFEEAAGLVAVDPLRDGNEAVGAELTCPEPLSRRGAVAPAAAAACLGLAAEDVRTDAHGPQVISVGLPFLVLELASREALRQARPDRRAYDSLFPLDGARSVYAYTRDGGEDGPGVACDLHARMFTWRLVEDPATGSATAAVTALLADIRGAEVRIRVREGEDMGRPSELLTRSSVEGGAIMAHVGGRCAPVFRGVFDLF